MTRRSGTQDRSWDRGRRRYEPLPIVLSPVEHWAYSPSPLETSEAAGESGERAYAPLEHQGRAGRCQHAPFAMCGRWVVVEAEGASGGLIDAHSHSHTIARWARPRGGLRVTRWGLLCGLGFGSSIPPFSLLPHPLFTPSFSSLTPPPFPAPSPSSPTIGLHWA